MLYMVCPSCKKMLGDKQIQYETVLGKICRDEELGNISVDDANKLKSKLLLSFDFGKRYCCSPRLMTYKRLIDIVK